MFKLLSLIIESQSQPFSSFWVFSFSKPSKYQSKFRENWFFSPYRFDFFLEKKNIKHRYRNLFVFYNFYPIRSIFFDLSVFFKRKRAFKDCFPIYIEWLVERPWFKFIFKKALPSYGLTVGIIFFPLIAGYAMAFFRYYQLYFISFLKKKTWVTLFWFFWKSVFEKIVFFISSHLYILFFLFFYFFLVILIFFIILSLSFFFFYVIKKFYFFIIFNKSFFERGFMLSESTNFKLGLKNSSRSFFNPVFLNWRLSGFLLCRYAKILERFFSYQPPFNLQNEPLFVDFVGVRGSGWLKFNSFYSRVLIFQTFLPSVVGFYKKFKINRWRLLPFSFCWFSNVTRRTKKFRCMRFYSKNFILYQPFGERFLQKSFPFIYNSVVLFYLKSFIHYGSFNSFLEPVVLKSQPWWIYRERFLYFFYVRWFFFYFFSLHALERPFRGNLIRLYRPTVRRLFLYDIFEWFVAFRLKTTRLFNRHPMSNVLFSKTALLYTNLWIWVFCCLEAFSWFIFFPIRWSFKVKKNRFFWLFSLIILIFVCLMLLN